MEKNTNAELFDNVVFKSRDSCHNDIFVSGLHPKFHGVALSNHLDIL